jgi:hypothetical protein
MMSKELFQRIVLATVLAVGFLCLWTVVGVCCLEQVSFAAIRDWEGEYLDFRADGEALLAHHTEEGKTHYRNLQDHSVTPPEDDPNAWLNVTPLRAGVWSRESAEVAWGEHIHTHDDGRTPAVLWHFVSDGRSDGTGYFVGYGSQRKECVGYLGTAGFREHMPPAEELFPFAQPTLHGGSLVFSPASELPPLNESAARARRPDSDSMPGRWIVYILGRDRKLYEIDVRAYTVRVLFDEPRLCTAALIADTRRSAHAASYRLAARTEDAVFVLDQHGRLVQRYPIPQSLRDRAFSFAETTTGEALMHEKSPENFMAMQVESRMWWVLPNGRDRTESVALPNIHPMQSLRKYGVAVVPAPAVLDVFVGIIWAAVLRDDGLAATFPEAMGQALTQFWPALVIAQLLAVALALLCHRRQVRYGASRAERIVWPLFVLLLGLPGWIGYRFGRSWPVLEACPECGQTVLRDRDDCIRCAAEFPLPALKGTEVFA